jgi:alkanesulfonate monooxygenase SsuD/methylene tetrahydromethanopterin reductase-like flavin-dependent oxidoreductase (luciferase family)
VRVCLFLEGQEGVQWGQYLALAEAAEAAGLDGLFRSDHYRSVALNDPAGSLEAGSLEAWATLAALAARTERLRLGSLVSPVTFRHPSVLAKLVVTVDHISGGRAELGIGAGHYELEHQAYGFPYLSARERTDELGRQLAEVRRQWAEADDVWPKPVQRPHPPIIVGGSARPRTVQAAVRFADEYNSTQPTLEEAQGQCRSLRQAARLAGRESLRFSMLHGIVLGRDEAEVRERLAGVRSRFANILLEHPELVAITGTVEQVSELLRRYQAVGVERVMLRHLLPDDLDMVALMGELAQSLPD